MPRRRLYVPLDVDFFDDPKIIEARERSPWNEILFCCALAIAKHAEHDGLVTRVELIRSRVPNLTKRIKDLVDVGILVPAEGGWMFRAWLQHNLRNDLIEEKRRVHADTVAAARAGNVTTETGRKPPDSDDRVTGHKPVTEQVTEASRDESQTDHVTSTLQVTDLSRDRSPLSSKPEAVSLKPEAFGFRLIDSKREQELVDSGPRPLSESNPQNTNGTNQETPGHRANRDKVLAAAATIGRRLT